MNNEYVVHEEEYRGLTIKIISDNDGGWMNPVEDYDMLGTQVYWHRSRNLGHSYKETNKYDPQEWLEREINDDVYDIWEEKHSKRLGYLPYLFEIFEKANLIIPVHAYEHGGITISASGRRAGWDSFDSGQLGFVYVSHEDIKKNFLAKRITKKLLERAEKVLIAEVNTYDSYLRGEVYGYRIEDENGDELESCWGYIGDYRGVLPEAKSQANYWANKIEEDLKELDNRMTGK